MRITVAGRPASICIHSLLLPLSRTTARAFNNLVKQMQQVKAVELPIASVLDKIAPSAELLVQATKTKVDKKRAASSFFRYKLPYRSWSLNDDSIFISSPYSVAYLGRHTAGNGLRNGLSGLCRASRWRIA